MDTLNFNLSAHNIPNPDTMRKYAHKSRTNSLRAFPEGALAAAVRNGSGRSVDTINAAIALTSVMSRTHNSGEPRRSTRLMRRRGDIVESAYRIGANVGFPIALSLLVDFFLPHP